jgi:hypothetical protein
VPHRPYNVLILKRKPTENYMLPLGLGGEVMSSGGVTFARQADGKRQDEKLPLVLHIVCWIRG